MSGEGKGCNLVPVWERGKGLEEKGDGEKKGGWVRAARAVTFS